jgi:3-oxoacyl-(acyl-carrier-protein) synthase
MAEDLMAGEDLDCCLVVAAEEADWLLCDAYSKWRLVRSAPPIEPFQQPSRGTILSEGAGAILIGRSGPIQIDEIASGTNFSKQREARTAVDRVFAELCAAPPDLVSASANGTFIDDAEQRAVLKHSAQAQVYSVKQALGEGVGASSLWQTIAGAEALITQKLPGSTKTKPLRTVLVSTCGLNQQVAGLRISRS